MMKWHRLSGLALTDYFTGSAYQVELEKELSLRRQLPDVIIIEKDDGEPLSELPDGLENLAFHNLITFKSHRETPDAWAIDELTGHYVNYRKQVSPGPDSLLPETDFRLYGICSGMPYGLMRAVPLRPVSEGVHDVRWGAHDIRIIVLSRVPGEDRNALWHLFGATEAGLRFGAARHQWRTHISLP